MMRTDRQRSDGIGRTVLQTVAPKLCESRVRQPIFYANKPQQSTATSRGPLRRGVFAVAVTAWNRAVGGLPTHPPLWRKFEERRRMCPKRRRDCDRWCERCLGTWRRQRIIWWSTGVANVVSLLYFL